MPESRPEEETKSSLLFRPQLCAAGLGLQASFELGLPWVSKLHTHSNSSQQATVKNILEAYQ